MAADPKRGTLGRGLSALLGDEAEDMTQLERLRTGRTLPVDQLCPSPFQPRRHMDKDDLAELAQSIAEKGILQPLLVRRTGGDDQSYEIIAGERRWRAAQMAQVHDVPVVIKDLSDQEALEIGLIENLQRQDLSPLEEAQGYRRLMDEFAHSQENLAQTIGKSRSHVANTLRLLGLSEPIKDMLESGSLTAGHARALIGLDDGEAVARTIVERGLNVRQTEQLVAARRAAPPSKPRVATEKDADTVALERELSARLGLRVTIKFRGAGGSLILHYQNLDQLDDILHRLKSEHAIEENAGSGLD